MASGRGSVYPVQFDLDRSRSLRIVWTDGLEQEISLTALRRACPCATCRAEREQAGRNPLRVLPLRGDLADMVQVAEAELVGNYALRVVWRDGHSTGIYDFGLLRSLKS